MRCSQRAIQYTLAMLRFGTFQGRNPLREYKRKTTACEVRCIETVLKQNDSLPLRDITNIVNTKITLISTTTLGRRRSEWGLSISSRHRTLQCRSPPLKFGGAGGANFVWAAFAPYLVWHRIPYNTCYISNTVEKLEILKCEAHD